MNFLNNFSKKAFLIKIMRIFYCLSRSVYLSERPNEANQYRTQLKDNIAIIKNLSIDSEKNENNALYRMYFVCVSYLQEKLVPVETLIDIDDIRNFAQIGIIQNLFDKTSDEFKTKCSVANREFINELNETESSNAYDLFMMINQNTPVNSVASLFIPDLLANAIVMWSTCWKSDEIKLMGYENFQNFYRSVIFHGFDTEKLLAIKLLKNFCSFETLRVKIFQDKELINYIISLQTEDNSELKDNIKIRLNKCISSLLAQESIS